MRLRTLSVAQCVLACTVISGAGAQKPVADHWRSATSAELAAVLPARAPVERERIETEMRTANGIIDSQHHVVAAVVLITAGYAADGKYSHYLLVQTPMTIQGSVKLQPGTYVVGWKRSESGLDVHFYDSATGAERGTGIARLQGTTSRVESFRIWPPKEQIGIQIGRFVLPYTLDRP